MKGLIFADKKRGIYAQSDGALIFTTPGTFNSICSPFFIPPPFRIYTSEDIDPYIIAFSQNGIIFVFNVKECICTTTTNLPQLSCIITKIKILSEGKDIELTTENEKIVYDGCWHIIEENPDKLLIQNDQKIVSQFSQLEDEVCAACHHKNMNAFKTAVEKYSVYMAQHLPIDKFMTCWFDLIKRSSKLGEKALTILKNTVDSLENFEGIQPHVDELRMTLSII